jgi:hypothetical protein
VYAQFLHGRSRALVLVVGTTFALAASAGAEVSTQASVTIADGGSTATGANVVLNILTQTNILVTVGGASQAIASVSVPQSLTVANTAGAEVRLPTVVTPLAGGGALAGPNTVAMSVGDGGGQPAAGGPAANNTMMIVVQYN